MMVRHKVNILTLLWGLYGIIWDGMGLCRIKCDYMNQLYGITWYHMGLYGILWGYAGLCVIT